MGYKNRDRGDAIRDMVHVNRGMGAAVFTMVQKSKVQAGTGLYLKAQRKTPCPGRRPVSWTSERFFKRVAADKVWILFRFYIG
jgi:hypothetical protein